MFRKTQGKIAELARQLGRAHGGLQGLAPRREEERRRRHQEEVGPSLITHDTSLAIRGSFSAGLKPIFASKYAFFSKYDQIRIFQHFSRATSKIFSHFCTAPIYKNSLKKIADVADFFVIVHYFCSKSPFFAPILMNFSLNFAEIQMLLNRGGLPEVFPKFPA